MRSERNYDNYTRSPAQPENGSQNTLTSSKKRGYVQMSDGPNTCSANETDATNHFDQCLNRLFRDLSRGRTAGRGEFGSECEPPGTEGAVIGRACACSNLPRRTWIALDGTRGMAGKGSEWRLESSTSTRAYSVTVGAVAGAMLGSTACEDVPSLPSEACCRLGREAEGGVGIRARGPRGVRGV